MRNALDSRSCAPRCCSPHAAAAAGSTTVGGGGGGGGGWHSDDREPGHRRTSSQWWWMPGPRLTPVGQHRVRHGARCAFPRPAPARRSITSRSIPAPRAAPTRSVLTISLPAFRQESDDCRSPSACSSPMAPRYGPLATADMMMPVSGKTARPAHRAADRRAAAGNRPADCPGTPENTVATFGANGILGVGPFMQDCGAAVHRRAGRTAGNYYTCPTPAHLHRLRREPRRSRSRIR